MKIDFKNSPKMEFCFLGTEIWYARLELHIDAMIIMQDKKFQIFPILKNKNLNASNR